jgi:single-strand DNA-binding protein
MYQQLTLIGNLGNDPEMRYSNNGEAVANFSLAVSKSWTGANGQRQEKTTWFRVSIWGKQAEAVSTYLKKGSKAMVVGEIEEPRVFADRDGNQRAALEVKAQTVRFLDSRSDSANHDGGGTPTQSAQPVAAQSTPTKKVEAADIPF